MKAQKALGWILTHLGRSRRKHPNVDSLPNALSRVALVFERAKAAGGAGGGVEDRPLFARSMLETAALCVRSVVDMQLDHTRMDPMPEGDLATEPWIVQLTVPRELRGDVDFMDPEGLTGKVFDWQSPEAKNATDATSATTTPDPAPSPPPGQPGPSPKPVPVDLPDWPDDPGRVAGDHN